MIVSLLTALYTKLISVVQAIFNTLFGNWNYGILFSWLPSDIASAASAFLLVCFAIAFVRILRDILPF